MAKPTRSRTPLPGISTRTWEHPADRSALLALRRLKGRADTVALADTFGTLTIGV